jgi:hypothetical protein
MATGAAKVIIRQIPVARITVLLPLVVMTFGEPHALAVPDQFRTGGSVTLEAAT